LVEIGLQVFEKKLFEGKFTLDGGWTLHHGISSHGLWPGELKINNGTCVGGYITVRFIFGDSGCLK